MCWAAAFSATPSPDQDECCRLARLFELHHVLLYLLFELHNLLLHLLALALCVTELFFVAVRVSPAPPNPTLQFFEAALGLFGVVIVLELFDAMRKVRKVLIELCELHLYSLVVSRALPTVSLQTLIDFIGLCLQMPQIFAARHFGSDCLHTRLQPIELVVDF